VSDDKQNAAASSCGACPCGRGDANATPNTSAVLHLVDHESQLSALETAITGPVMSVEVCRDHVTKFARKLHAQSVCPACGGRLVLVFSSYGAPLPLPVGFVGQVVAEVWGVYVDPPGWLRLLVWRVANAPNERERVRHVVALRETSTIPSTAPAERIRVDVGALVDYGEEFPSLPLQSWTSAPRKLSSHAHAS